MRTIKLEIGVKHPPCTITKIACADPNLDDTTMNSSDESIDDSASLSFEPGLCVQIHGLSRAPELNQTYGTLLAFHKEGPAAGRWGVRCDEDARSVAVNPEHLCLAAAPAPAPETTTAPGLLPPLPHLIDKWDDLTDTSAILDEQTLKTCRRLASSAETLAQAEQDIYNYINDENKEYDALHFPELFLFGKGTFAHMPDVRFEEYVSWLLRQHHGSGLLRQHHGNALQHDGWISFVTNRAAVLRQVMQRPPLWQTDPTNHRAEDPSTTTTTTTLTPRQADALRVLTKIDEKKAFCFRYLLGDLEASQVAELYLHDCYSSMGKR